MAECGRVIPTNYGRFVVCALKEGHQGSCSSSAGEHDLTGVGCWCSPRIEMRCPECEGKGEDCWRCADGWVPWDGSPDVDTITVHNYPEAETGP